LGLGRRRRGLGLLEAADRVGGIEEDRGLALGGEVAASAEATDVAIGTAADARLQGVVGAHGSPRHAPAIAARLSFDIVQEIPAVRLHLDVALVVGGLVVV